MNTRSPKVLILGLNYAPEPTGNAPYTTNLAESLAQHDFRVRVMSAHPHYPSWRVYPGHGGWRQEESQGRVHLTRLGHYVPHSPSNIRRLLSELSFGMRLLFSRWGRPDIVLLVSPALVSSSMALLRLRLSPSAPPAAIWVQDLYSLGITETGAGGAAVAKVMTWIESGTLRSSNRVIAIHDRFKRYMNGQLGVPNDQIEVIRNWTHLGESAPTDRVEWRTRFGWGENETIVLHAGNQGAKQGLENVVAAAQYAEKEEVPIRFVLLGDGNQRAKLEAIGSGLRHLQFIDPLPGDEYQHTMAASDVLLVNELPGVAEMAVPSKLTSYFSTGLPVIAATDEGSVTAEEIETSGGGLRVNAGDPRALVEGALALAADPVRSQELGSAGRHYRNVVLGQEIAVEKFANTLTSLLIEVKPSG